MKTFFFSKKHSCFILATLAILATPAISAKKKIRKSFPREPTSFLRELIWQTSGKKTHLFEKKILLSISKKWRKITKMKVQNICREL